MASCGSIAQKLTVSRNLFWVVATAAATTVSPLLPAAVAVVSYIRYNCLKKIWSAYFEITLES